jgi:hypothetical protein
VTFTLSFLLPDASRCFLPSLQVDIDKSTQQSHAREAQWRTYVEDVERKNHDKVAALSAEKERALKETEQEQLNSERQKAMSQARIQQLQNAAEQLRKREQAVQREKLALEVQLQKARESTSKWKCQAGLWKRGFFKKANEPISRQKRQTMYAPPLPPTSISIFQMFLYGCVSHFSCVTQYVP